MKYSEELFVGRQTELACFRAILENEKGQGVLVVGPQGMGKTLLLQRMAGLSQVHPTLKCASARYEIVPTDTADSIMSWLMDDANETAESIRQGASITGRNKEMWQALFSSLELLPIIGQPAGKIGGLFLSLHRDSSSSTREQFLETLTHISKNSPKNARAVFIIDPAKYMQKESADAWGLVVRDLPTKIKLVFAQRPDDVLADSETFCKLQNVVRIPEKFLDVLDNSSVEELVQLRCGALTVSIEEVMEAVRRYNGHPFATDAALRLVQAGTSPKSLPHDPSGIAQSQWKEICRRGKEAVSLFEAYAVFPVAIPDEAIESICGINSASLKSLFADNYLGTLMRQESNGKRIYHAILTDYVRQQINPAKIENYHDQLAGLLRSQTREDHFLSILLHGLRAPLVTIQHSTELLQEQNGMKGNRQLEDIQICVDQMSNLLSNASFFSRSNQSIAVDSKKCLMLNDIVIPTVNRLRVPLFNSGFQAEKISFHGFENFPALYLDEDLMQTAIRNLLENAIKYSSREGFRSFGVRLYGIVGRKTYAIVVANMGIGIEVGIEEKIFERGFRGHSTIQHSVGSGIGLWIAHRIIEAHGGTIRVRQNTNPTEIEICLPRQLASSPPMVKES